jgi:hypothetical protein
MARGIGGEHLDLTVVDLAQSATVLACDPLFVIIICGMYIKPFNSAEELSSQTLCPASVAPRYRGYGHPNPPPARESASHHES